MPQSTHPNSLPEVHRSVATSTQGSFFRRLFMFTGPAFMVSVGYMDPGNWVTDLAGGAQFGYRLIWVILLSNMMAILLQTLSARLGIATGRDLAQACREHYPRPVVWVLWLMCEVAIAACDLAEVLGSAIGLYLLTGGRIPLLWGVVITGFDVMVFLVLQSFGIRKLEAVILVLVATIGACFACEMFFSNPPIGPLMAGFIPHGLSGAELYVAIGIIGATVMPHNLYLHSALVQSRAFDPTSEGKRQANKFNLIDSVVALNAAFFVNAAILILAAAAFHTTGHSEVARLEDAHALLAPILGASIAPVLFAIALLAAGQSSTITGTMAGQIVIEGFIHIHVRPWLRRLITRGLAIIPAVLVIWIQGTGAVDSLMILSQVVLSLQLSFAIVPLLHFTRDRSKMKEFATPWPVNLLAWIVAAIIITLNLKLVGETLIEGLREGSPLARYLLLPSACVAVPLLVWMVAEPFYRSWRGRNSQRGAGARRTHQPQLPGPEAAQLASHYDRIGVALEVIGENDEQVLAAAVPLARATSAELVLIHVVESATARFIGGDVADVEARGDERYMETLAKRLTEAGLTARVRIGAGEPENEIARLAREEQLDLIVAGSHGHRWLGDLFHGSTVSQLRHQTRIPVLTVSVRRKIKKH